MATSIGQYAPVFLSGETPSLTEKPGRPQSTGSQRVGHDQSDPACIDTRLFLPVAALPQWKLSVNVVQLFGFEGPWRHQVCKDTECLPCRGYGPIRVLSSLLELAIRRPLWLVFLCSSTLMHLEGSLPWDPFLLFGTSGTYRPPPPPRPRLGSYSVDWCIRHLKGHPGWGPTL